MLAVDGRLISKEIVISADLPFTCVYTSMAKNKQSIDIYKPEKIFFFANISDYIYSWSKVKVVLESL